MCECLTHPPSGYVKLSVAALWRMYRRCLRKHCAEVPSLSLAPNILSTLSGWVICCVCVCRSGSLTSRCTPFAESYERAHTVGYKAVISVSLIMHFQGKMFLSPLSSSGTPPPSPEVRTKKKTITKPVHSVTEVQPTESFRSTACQDWIHC